MVGAGFAGVTAAAALSLLGYNVTLYERSANLIPVQLHCEKRHVDPHIYDWPGESWVEQDAGLPVLNWSAGSGASVRKSVLDQFETIRQGKAAGQIDVRLRSVITEINGTTVSIHDLESGEFDTASHVATVLAIGFGEERTFPGLLQYWHDDDLDQHFTPALQVHIPGTGDGALIDALRAGTADLSLKRRFASN